MKHEELPAGWAGCTLGEFTQKRGRSIDPRKSPNSIFELYSVPSFDAGAPDLVPGSEIGSSKQVVASGSVLLCKINPRINRSWKVKPTGEHDQIASTEWIVFPPSNAFEPDYLRYFMQQQTLRNFLAANVSGVGGSLMRVKPSTLKGYPFPLAPRAEQRRIVEKIETLFAELDKGEEALRKVQKLLSRYRQSVLKAAVTGDLTADWRNANGSPQETSPDLLARILKQRRESWQGRGKYTEPVGPRTEELPELPTGWTWATLAQLTNIKGGVTVDKKRDPSDPVTVPYLRVANVQNGYLDLTDIKEITVERHTADACLLQTNDILLNEGGDRDKLGRGWVWSGQIDPCIHQNHVFRARPIIADLSSRFISYYANAFGQPFFMTKGKQSVNLASISLTAISGLPIPLPPLDEQAEIVELIEERISQIDGGMTASECELVRSKALRQSILKDAFSGRLVPQDRADEPAKELLECASRSTRHELRISV